MLTELKLANFKLFTDEATVRFRPITVFIGGNNSGKTAIIDFLTLLQQTPKNNPYQFSHHEKTFLNGINRGTYREPFANMQPAGSTNQVIRFSLTARLPAALRASRTNRPWYCQSVAAADYHADSPGGLVKYALLNRAGQEVLRLPAAVTPRWCDPIPATAPERRLSFAAAHFPNPERECRQELERLHFLRAHREHPATAVAAKPRTTDQMSRNGGDAIHHLKAIHDRQDDAWNFLAPQLAAIANIAELKFRPTDRFVNYTENGPEYNCTRAFVRASPGGPETDLSATGHGAANAVSILTAGAILEPEATLVVEHPETSLDPATELAMGQYFADLWWERQVGSIIETHSDKLLLRLRRLVAIGLLNPEDLAIAYFTADPENGNRPMVKNLEVNPDGSLSPGLPMALFGADLIEGLAMNAGK